MSEIMNAKRPKKSVPPAGRVQIERVQTGIRVEKRLLKVLKGLAEYHDLTLGDLLEGIILHAFDGRLPFGEESRRRIAQLRELYGLRLTAADSHRLFEDPEAAPGKGGRR